MIREAAGNDDPGEIRRWEFYLRPARKHQRAHRRSVLELAVNDDRRGELAEAESKVPVLAVPQHTKLFAAVSKGTERGRIVGEQTAWAYRAVRVEIRNAGPQHRSVRRRTIGRQTHHAAGHAAELLLGLGRGNLGTAGEIGRETVGGEAPGAQITVFAPAEQHMTVLGAVPIDRRGMLVMGPLKRNAG